MRITKYGHCCMLIEEKEVRVLTDPGSWTTTQNEVKDINVIVITHEHPDHLHIESVKKVRENNPDSTIVTNSAVDKLLREAEIQDAVIIEDGQSQSIAGIVMSGHGHIHAEIYKSRNRVMNTGYIIGERLYYPGDAFHNPRVPVDVLALPVGGPWVKISDAIDFALEVKPKIVFPVHDGMLNENGLRLSRGLPSQVLGEFGVEFKVLELGQETEM